MTILKLVPQEQKANKEAIEQIRQIIETLDDSGPMNVIIGFEKSGDYNFFRFAETPVAISMAWLMLSTFSKDIGPVEEE